MTIICLLLTIEGMDFFRKVALFFYDALQTILLIAAVFLVIYIFVLEPHQVDGHSMDPTFQNGDFLLSYLLPVRFDQLQRGDIVVFNSPVEADKLYIKRVIALPGERIKVQDGQVYINGEKLDQSSFLAPDVMTYGGAFLQDGVEQLVPPGFLFVMGDNRPGSSDSRAWGFLDKKKLIGKSIIRFWPSQDFEIIKNPLKN